MEDWIKFSYISFCMYGYSFNKYKPDWSLEKTGSVYNYRIANTVRWGKRVFTTTPLGSKYIMKEINKYLVT